MYEEVFEKVLEIFPNECRKNYYNNKKTLKINKSLLKNSYGNYNNEKNIINLYDERSLPHELFHMAFRDKNKIRKKLYRCGTLIHSNGIAYKNIKTKEMGGAGLTEGFCEYLSRKCSNFKGHRYLYFFTDLLISIYGEDIIYYPLKNDIIGFVDDERFFSIVKLSYNMDCLREYSLIISYLNKNNDILDEMYETNTREENIELNKKIIALRNAFGKVIIDLFNQIIDEYNNYINPKISKKDFVDKMKKFIDSNDYHITSELEYENSNILDEVQNIITQFNDNKILIK